MDKQDYREARERLGLTHDDLADMLRVHPATSRAYASNTDPGGPVETALILIEHLGVKRAQKVLREARGEE